MSRSPRKHLQRAVAELDHFADVLATFPDTAVAVRSALGEDGVAAVLRARATLHDAFERLSAAPGKAEAPPASEGGAAAAEPR